ncbi:hypothetical protein [Phnomibacter ginsenosidimutans]|uniref:hypothetical protein n=1 Tax=Phnomibacter ginsenosidimutans TaxID=2676868 RepID=UPI001FE7FF44|nr:hypothetical protein [Phnomibacter ginsenosidimutans]
MEQVKLSALAESMQGSEIVKLGNMIRERIRLGDTIYNFTIGDFDPQVFPIPQGLEDAIIEAYKNRFTSYPLADGELDLREAVCAFTNVHSASITAATKFKLHPVVVRSFIPFLKHW